MLLEYDPGLSNIVSAHTTTHIINTTNALRYEWFFELLMDYGSNMGAPYNRRHNYILLVKYRIAECRRALLALLSACDTSKLHNRGPFGGGAGFAALRGIMIQIASQAWAMRGGEGCGPRGHLWCGKGS